jgi:hypothetical protein
LEEEGDRALACVANHHIRLQVQGGNTPCKAMQKWKVMNGCTSVSLGYLSCSSYAFAKHKLFLRAWMNIQIDTEKIARVVVIFDRRQAIEVVSVGCFDTSPIFLDCKNEDKTSNPSSRSKVDLTLYDK